MEKISELLLSDLSKNNLISNLFKRLNSYFFLDDKEKAILKAHHNKILYRLELCFSKIDNKYYKKNENLWFSYLHSGQYLSYLYLFSNELYITHNDLSSKLYYLNKILHGVDILGAVELPESFFFEHPLGLVLGRAKYGNGFFAMQGCTVGGNKGKYPTMGINVKMYSNSKVLGSSIIGDNVIIAANTYIKDENIASNSLIFGQSPNLIIKKNKEFF